MFISENTEVSCVSVRYCRHCGASLGPDASFCGSCGKQTGPGGPLPASPAPGTPPYGSGSGTGQPEGKSLAWTARYSMTGGFMVKRLLVVLAIASLFPAVVIGIANPASFPAGLMMSGIIFLFILGIGAIVTIAMQKATKGGFDTKFSITPGGVSYQALEDWKGYNRVVLGGSLLSGSLPAIGGSAVTIAREEDTMAWEEIGTITIYSRDLAIYITRKALVFPMVLFGTPGNFGAAVGLVREYAARYNITVKEG